MLDFITEKINSWDYLKSCGLPVFIYGMGDGADKILRVFEEKGIACSGFFASDEFVRGHSFKGHLVHKLSEIEAAVEEFVIVLAFGAGYDSLYNRIMDISHRHILIAPDVPVVGEGLFTYEYCLANSDKLRRVYDMLADDISRRTFADVINFRISGKPCYLHRCTVPRSDIFNGIISLDENEEYIDMGAYNGDTVREFVNITGGKYKRIFALEPDSRNYKKLTANTADIPRLHTFNAAAWDTDGEGEFSDRSGRNARLSNEGQRIKRIPLLRGDSLTENATLIKMDVEGAEMQAIKGCASSIKNDAKLICALYHRNEDIFEIPLAVHEMNPELKLYIRHLLYIPAWETNLYAV